MFWDEGYLYLYTDQNLLYQCYKRNDPDPPVSSKGNTSEEIEGVANLLYQEVLEVSYDSSNDFNGHWNSTTYLKITTAKGDFKVCLWEENYRADEDNEFCLIFAQDCVIRRGEDADHYLKILDGTDLTQDFSYG